MYLSSILSKTIEFMNELFGKSYLPNSSRCVKIMKDFFEKTRIIKIASIILVFKKMIDKTKYYLGNKETI